jgi:hypothetical protein
MDIYGDHALCYKKSGDMITRHNRVRNLIYSFADVGLMQPELEKLGILGPTDRSRRRPGDISFKQWAPSRGLAIDVAVICPLVASHLSEEEPCTRVWTSSCLMPARSEGTNGVIHHSSNAKSTNLR